MMKLSKFFKRQEGQALIEYGLILPGVFFIAMGSAWLLGPGARDVFCTVSDTLNYPACAELSPEWGQPVVEEPLVCHTLLEEQGASECDQSTDCVVLPGEDSGIWTSPDRELASFVIKAARDYHIYQSGITWDGCYLVQLGEFDGDPPTYDPYTVIWERVGSGPQCQGVSHLQSWYTPLCTP